jgi:hypothetical protein
MEDVELESSWKKTVKSFCDLDFVSGSLYMLPKDQAPKKKADKLDLVIIQNFCASNNTTQKVKGPTE